MGMVDALRSAMRALRPRGEILDVRPAPGREPRILSRGRVVGRLVTRDEAATDDGLADDAVDRLVREGSLRRVKRGHIWYRLSLPDAGSLEDYLGSSMRFGTVSPGTMEALAHRRNEPVTLRRALAYQVLICLPAPPRPTPRRSRRAGAARRSASP